MHRQPILSRNRTNLDPRRNCDDGSDQAAGPRKRAYDYDTFAESDALDLLWQLILGSGAGQSLRVNDVRSEEHTSELQSLMSISYAVFCLKQKTTVHPQSHVIQTHKQYKRN